MSFKDKCKQAIGNLDGVQEPIKAIVNEYIDELEVIYKETGSVVGFKTKAEAFTRNKLLDIKKIRNQVITDLAKAQERRRILQIGVEERVAAGQSEPDAVAEAVKALIGETTDVTHGGKYSVESRSKSFSAALMVTLRDLDKIDTGSSKISARSVFESKAIDREITQELFELGAGKSGGISGNKLALDIAKVLHRFNETELNIKQGVGIYVGKAISYVTNLKYSAEKFKAVKEEEFVDFMLNRIDIDKSFANSKAEIENSLRGMYKKIRDGKDLSYFEDIDPALQETFSYTAKNHKRLANKYTKNRKLVFKDGNAMFEVMEKFAEDGLANSFYGRIASTSRNASLIDVFGSNPDLAYDNLKKWVRNNYGDEALKKTQGFFDNADRMFELAKGVRVEDNLGNKFINGAISFEVFKRLGSAVLSATGDFPMAIALVQSRAGMGYFESIGTLFEEFWDTFKPYGHKLEFAESLEILMENEIGQLFRHFQDNATSTTSVSKLADTVLSISGFNRQIFSARHSVAMVMARSVARAAEEGFDKAHPSTKKFLQAYGFSDAELTLLKSGVKEFKTAEFSRKIISTESLKEGLSKLDEATVTSAKELANFSGSNGQFIDNMVNRYRSFLSDAAEIGSPTPGIRDRAILKMGVDANTPAGQAIRLMTLFKSFALAFPRKVSHIVKSNPELLNKPFGDALKTKQGLTTMGKLVGGLTAMALLQQTARDASKGKVPDLEAIKEDPTIAAKKVKDAFLNSGVLGLFGSFLGSITERGLADGTSEFVLGPALSELKDIGSTSKKLYSSAVGAATGELGFDEAASKAFSDTLILASKQIPNVWYGGAALKYSVINAIQEQLDPESAERRRNLLQRYDEEAGRRSIFE